MRTLVSVIGGGSCSTEEYARAREIGRLLAERGYAVLTGGLGGVMEAAHRGARETGGLTIGVLPGFARRDANPYAEIVLTTGLREARNVIVATSGRAVIAVGGGAGTLSEIAFALKHGIPVVGLGTWALPERPDLPGRLVHARSPAHAVSLVDAEIQGG